MAVNIQVNGPAVVYVRLPTGTPVISEAGTYLPLGICRGSLMIRINYKDTPVMADNAGDQIPADLQYKGKDANIIMSLSEFDPEVLAAVDAGLVANGLLDQVGGLYGAGGRTFGIGCPSLAPPFLNDPWKFPNCVLRPRGDSRGTNYSTVDLEFYAYALVGNTISSVGVPLFFPGVAVP